MNLLNKKNKPYIIAEVAQAHDGSLGAAHAYIDAVADSGADAIKFQTHFANEESTYDEPWRIKFSTQDISRFDYWKRIEFSENQWLELKEHADIKNIDFLSSPFSKKAFNLLKKLRIKFWKIASGEVHNKDLLDLCVNDSKPLLISTGLIDNIDLLKLYNYLLKRNKKFSFFHCISMYPAPPEHWNLNKITEMQKMYKCPIGFSDHSGEIYSGLSAATLGVNFIEVHVTLDKRSFGPDTSASLSIEQLKYLVDGSKKINISLNSKKLSKDFKVNKKIFTRSWALNTSLKKGEIIKKQFLILKKPGTGIPYNFKKKILGKKLKKDKSKDYLLNFNDLTN